MSQVQKIIQRSTQILFLALCCLFASCSRQYGAYFMRSAAGGGGLLAGTKKVVLVDSTLAKVNQANLWLLAKKQNAPLSRSEQDSLRSGLQLLGGHIAAKGHLDKQTKEAYQVVLLANKPRMISTKADRANYWDFAMAGQGAPIGLNANNAEEPLVFGEGKVIDDPTWYQEPQEDIFLEQLLAALLCFFIGWTGAHRFYLGYPKQGYMQLGLALGPVLMFLLVILYLILTRTLGTQALGASLLVLTAFSWTALLIWLAIDLLRIIFGDLRKVKKVEQPIPEWRRKYEGR